MRSRRIGAALMAAGLACGAGAVAVWQVPAGAQELQSFELRARANGFAMIFPAGEGVEAGGFVPTAETSLEAGPIGRGLASIAWPGATAANAGALLAVVAPQAPKEAANLNYPVRAESRTGDDPPTKTFNAPGVNLRSTSLPDLIEADASVQSATSGLVSTGTVQTKARNQVTDSGGVSESSSSVTGFSVAGVLKIESVTSTAKAVSASASTAEAKTVVSGVTVADQPATIDERGLVLSDQQGTPIGAVANQLAKQALQASGITVTVTAPEKKVDGPTAEAYAGVVVISYKTESGPFSITLGGASASATSGAGLGDLSDLGGDLGLGGDVAPVDSGLTDVGSVPVDTGSLGTDTGTGTGTGGGEVALGPVQNAATGKPLRPGAVILGVLAAGLLAVGMRRLGDDVLAEQAGTTCTLEGEG